MYQIEKEYNISWKTTTKGEMRVQTWFLDIGKQWAEHGQVAKRERDAQKTQGKRKRTAEYKYVT